VTLLARVHPLGFPQSISVMAQFSPVGALGGEEQAESRVIAMKNNELSEIARHRALLNVNRVLILVVTIGGQLMDGFQGPDLAGAVTVAAWLWLGTCARFEAKIASRFFDKSTTV
jgi:hypothetical protein